MKKFLSITMAIMMIVTVFTLTSCGDKGADELYIYNSKGENAKEFDQMVADFTSETGIKARAFSIGSGQDHMETLRAEMNKKGDEMPGVFSIQSLGELVEWRESGKALDLSKIKSNDDSKDFLTLATNVQKDVRLTTDGTNSYGIPYGLEGYGYAYDTQMLKDLFAGVDVAEDVAKSSYEEFAAFGNALTTWIETPTAAKVTLNGVEHSFAATKTGRAALLTGMFAMAGAEKWTYGDHLLNTAIAGAYSSSFDSSKANLAGVEASKGAFKAYADVVDYNSSHAAGQSRGADFVTKVDGSYDKSVSRFMDGSALFIKQGNWVYNNFAKTDKTIADRTAFVPVKMPWTEDNLKNGKSIEKMNDSVSVFVPNYYAINAQCSEQMQVKSMKFLTWLNTSNTGKDYIVNKFSFTPYDADPSTTVLPNPLGKSLLGYLADDNVYGDPYHGLPAGTCGDTIGAKVQDMLSKNNFSEADKIALSEFCVTTWATKANLK